ncbi:MAG: cyclase family protein, partial [Nitrososphaerota archaeon]|nr:cyclase family protein [Nitrososphaerota archaeon]
LEPGTEISPKDLEPHLGEVRKGDIVLLYTGMSLHWDEEWARTNFTCLGNDAAMLLVRRGARAVGIDYMSIDRYGSDHATHKTLLGNGVPIIESLGSGLRGLAGRRALLVCLPLRLGGCDGSPARALAYPLEAQA